MFVWGGCCTRLYSPPLAGTATLRPLPAPFPRLPAVPELSRPLSQPPLAVTSRTGPRRVRGGRRCASRKDTLPAHHSSHAAHGGAPGGESSGLGWGAGRGGSNTPLHRPGCGRSRQLSGAPGSADRLTGASERPSAALLPRSETRHSKKRRGPTLRSTAAAEARGLGGDPCITRLGDRRGDSEILFSFLPPSRPPPRRLAMQRSRVAFKCHVTRK